MEEYHGEDESEEDEDDDDEEPFELEPVAGSALVVPERAAAGQAAPLTLPRTGAGGSRPRPSSAGTGASDVEELLQHVATDASVFRPDQEGMGALLARIARLVMALKILGHEVKPEDLDRVTLKAEIIQDVYDRVGIFGTSEP